jgi:zinc transport system substrate-binding protein
MALSMGTPALAKPPAVVVTVLPVHSLVAGVMADVGMPALLLPPGASPHAYALRPSDARWLARARIVVRVGPTLEGFLDKPLATLAHRARVVTLTRDAGLSLRHAAGDGDHAHGVDPHVWLDPANARRIVDHMAAVLAEEDPPNAVRYADNAARTVVRLAALDREIADRLASVRAVPYTVFHDAYGYYEARYGLARVATVSGAPDRLPGARRLAAIRRTMARTHARCIFAEPQFRPALVAALARATGARPATLDPIGSDLPPGAGAYFTLMRNLATALRACLADPGPTR